MMLVDADSVETDRVGELQLIQVVVVRLVPDRWIEQLGRGQVNPHAVIALPKIVRQLRIGHQVEEVELHARASTLLNWSWSSRVGSIAARLASNASTKIMCPAPGISWLDASGRRAANALAYSGGTNRSRAPWTTRVGARTRWSRRDRPRSGIGHRKRATVVM